MGTIDGHAKNISLFLLPDGSYRLTPLCVVLSAWPVIAAVQAELPSGFPEPLACAILDGLEGPAERLQKQFS